jgi:aminopeptidase YwaD
MKSRLRLIAFAFAMGGTVFSSLEAQTPSDAELLLKAKEQVSILTSREFAGRGYQEEGHLKAARWIAEQFEALGVKPAGSSSTNPFFQPFKFSLNVIDSASLAGKKLTLAPGTDFIVNGNSSRGTGVKRKVVNMGYGMPDDYKKFKGGVVVIREGLPPAIMENAELKAQYSALQNAEAKAGLAIQKNADAVIILRKKLTGSFSSNPFERPCFEVFDSLWPGKIKTLDFNVSANFRSVQSQNVVGKIVGSRFPDSCIIVSAHYDHLGMLNQAIFPGANDNASGIATLLSIAGHFSKPENQPECTILFIAFGAEEVGLVGSQHYVTREPLIPLVKTGFILNLDLMGNGDKGITAVAGSDYPDLFDRLVKLNGEMKAVPEVKARKNAPNSDHYYFVQAGVKGFFIYTLGGPPHYHDVNDTAENLVFSRFLEVRGLLIAWLEQW